MMRVGSLKLMSQKSTPPNGGEIGGETGEKLGK